MTAPRPAHTHTWDGGPLPGWLDGHHHFDGGQLVIHTPDSEARPQPGWWLIGWSDGTVTVATPTIGEREYGAGGLHARLVEAEAAVARVTALHEQWVKAGPPPLGASMARWWDRRLAEHHNAIQSAGTSKGQ